MCIARSIRESHIFLDFSTASVIFKTSRGCTVENWVNKLEISRDLLHVYHCNVELSFIKHIYDMYRCVQYASVSIPTLFRRVDNL